VQGGKPYAGGYPIVSPLGTIYSTNITPSKTAGIGNWTEAQFARAVRGGVSAHGQHLYPAMPYAEYSGMTDADVHALYSYIMKDVAPVDDPRQKTTALAFPYNIRLLMAGWNLLFVSNQRYTPAKGVTPEQARGKYLVDTLGHCGSCHTPRNLIMASDQKQYLAGGDVGGWHAPNITSDPVSGIGGWSEDDLVAFFRTGHVDGKAQAAGGMAEAVQNSLRHLSDADLHAMAAYLKTVPAKREPGETQPRYSFGMPSAAGYSFDDPRSRATSAAADAARKADPAIDTQRSNAQSTINGAVLYQSACASCHQLDGSGTADHYYPSLFHNSVVGATTPNNLVMAILQGVSRVGADGPTHMPTFRDDMTDDQVASVANFVAKTFGNPKLTVTAADVATIRQGGPTPALQRLMPWAMGGLLVIAILLAMFGTRALRRNRRRT
jgi:mono/diheme cytochrome c family protein